MIDNQTTYRLTDQDKDKYRNEVLKVDLTEKERILEQIPSKLKGMVTTAGLHPFQIDLLSDVSKLYTILSESTRLDEELQKWILFGLKYFVDSHRDIPDDLPDIGYLDDAVVIRWVIDQTMLNYPESFDG